MDGSYVGWMDPGPWTLESCSFPFSFLFFFFFFFPLDFPSFIRFDFHTGFGLV